MKYGSVCSGVEAASLAWEPLGWEAAWFAEIEAFPSAVLAHHWPHVPNHGDMLTLPEKVANEDIPAPDVLVGGTPCQAFSVAGRRGSLEDERGALSLAYVELANAIDTVRSARGEEPCIIVWENVPGVLSTRDNAFGCFLAGLAGETEPLESPGKRWANAGCVFGPQRTVAWRTLDAQYFGLAQRRRRVFVVASARDGFDPGAVLFECEGVRRDSPPSRSPGQDAAATVTSCIGKNGGIPAGKDATPRHLIPVAFGQNRQSGPVETSHALNAHAGPHGRLDFESETFLVQKWTPPTMFAEPLAFVQNSRDEVRLMGGDGQVVGALSAQPGSKQQCYVVEPITGGDVTHALNTANNGKGCSEDGTGRGVPTIAFSAKDYKDGTFETVDVAQPLTTSTDRSRAAPLSVQEALGVRRLTPVECERLQGFPDGWTDVQYRNRPAADGPRYKAIGNSMAVAVMGWIGQRVDALFDAPTGSETEPSGPEVDHGE